MTRFPDLDRFIADLERDREFSISELWRLWCESRGIDHTARHPHRSFFRYDLVQAGMSYGKGASRLVRP